VADLTLQMIDFLKSDTTVNSSAATIGEIANVEDGHPFIYVRRSGSEQTDALNKNQEDSVFFDLEITGDDINKVRDLSESVKTHLRNASWPTQISSIQFFDVDDHDDNYIRKTTNDDTRETAALQVRGFTP